MTCKQIVQNDAERNASTKQAVSVLQMDCVHSRHCKSLWMKARHSLVIRESLPVFV